MVDTPLPHVSFRVKTFVRRILSNDEIDANLVWKPANLHMCDTYGGPTRCVVVDMAWLADIVFLRCIESLPKREFEDLFGFGIMCQDYDENKVVQVIAPNNYYTNFQ